MRCAALTIALVACTAAGDGTPGGAPAADARGGEPAADARGGTGEPPELAGITLAHNEVRAMVETATPLPSLAWDASLAATAAAYVELCRDADGDGLVDHNDNRSAGHPYYVGENIYATTGTARGAAAVDAWAGERASYDYARNACDPGAVCGHYTQLVWRASQKVGCAVHRCEGLKYPNTIVCDYGPGGNVVGQRPY